ncbi:hypothetical protein MKW92_010885, partial [Papaver armeniacum]
MENAATPLGRHRQFRAAIWDHFVMEEPPSKHAMCRIVTQVSPLDPLKNGTSSLFLHLKR